LVITYLDNGLSCCEIPFPSEQARAVAIHLIQMEEPIRNALADKDYALAQSLVDDWLSLAPDVAVAHYLAAWARDAQGSDANPDAH
jgi:hypothetical protein